MAPAVNISSAGVEGTGGGLLQIDNTDPYWWFGAQNGAEGPLAAGPAGYEANLVSLDYGWSHQTTDRSDLVDIVDASIRDDLPRQANVIAYVLDTYLPWADAGPSGRFLEKAAVPVGSTDLEANDSFFNTFFAAQEYTSALYNKLYTDAANVFVPLSVFSPANPFSTSGTAAEAARAAFFDAIKDDINAKMAGDASYFDSYKPEHGYAVVNTLFPEGDKDDWRDAVILQGAVPEPSSGLLALGGILLLARRRRI